MGIGLASWLWVALGGAIGSVARFAISIGLPLQSARFPWATFTVNMLGSLLIGVAFALLYSRVDAYSARLFIVTGFLGGFTTFSAFSLEALLLLQQEQWIVLVSYIVASIAFGLMAVALGFYTAKYIF